MKIPKWAPSELVQVYEAVVEAERGFDPTNHSPSDLDLHARTNYFPNWKRMEIFLRERNRCLERLLTHESARDFWAWFRETTQYPEEQIVLLWKRVSIALEQWHKGRMTLREMRRDCREIENLARSLSAILEKHFGHWELDVSQDYRALVPAANHMQLQALLHPELIETFRRRGHSRVEFLDRSLPPLFLLLDRLAVNASDACPRAISRKARDRSALRALLLDALFWSHAKFQSAYWANFLAVALDDDSITDATVRMAAKERSWWAFAKDSGDT